MSNFRDNLARKLKKLRQSLNITQKEAAEALNLGHAKAISQIESGERSISAEELLKLSILYQKDISYFYTAPKSKDDNLNQIIDTYGLIDNSTKPLFNSIFKIICNGLQNTNINKFDTEGNLTNLNLKKTSSIIGNTNLKVLPTSFNISSNEIILSGNFPTKSYASTNIIEFIDISNPSRLMQNKNESYKVESKINDIQTLANILFVAGNEGIFILDTAITNNIKQVFHINELKNVIKIQIVSNYAYIGSINNDKTSNINIYDITIPSRPLLVSKINLNCVLESFDIDNEIILAASSDSGIYIINYSNFKKPYIVNTFDQIEYVISIKIAKMYGYKIALLCCGFNGLKILDYGNNKNPRIIGELELDLALNLEILNNLAFIAGNTVKIIDFANPQAPILKETIENIRSSIDLKLNGNILYILENNCSLRVVKINPF